VATVLEGTVRLDVLSAGVSQSPNNTTTTPENNAVDSLNANPDVESWQIPPWAGLSTAQCGGEEQSLTTTTLLSFIDTCAAGL
jgi:hypothetical protein